MNAIGIGTGEYSLAIRGSNDLTDLSADAGLIVSDGIAHTKVGI
jgi:hypothetical protein